MVNLVKPELVEVTKLVHYDLKFLLFLPLQSH